MSDILTAGWPAPAVLLSTTPLAMIAGGKISFSPGDAAG